MKAQIDLFNTSFVLHSDEKNEYIQSLVAYIKGRADDVREDVEIEDPLKHAILTMLLITHELKYKQAELKKNDSFAMDSIKTLVTLLEDGEPLNIAPNPSAPSSNQQSQQPVF